MGDSHREFKCRTCGEKKTNPSDKDTGICEDCAEPQLTDKQIEQQDFVDNAILNMVNELSGGDKDVEWDSEFGGPIRDMIWDWLVAKGHKKESEEIEWYPYIPHEQEGTGDEKN